MKPELTLKLINRGDVVAIENGRLIIEPKSGMPIPEDWLRDNTQTLIDEITRLMKINAYQFQSYKTGRYDYKGRKCNGVNLSFVDIKTGETAYAIFNAELDRERNTKHGKAGSPLPDGQFRVRKNHGFYKFWKRTHIPLPKRLSLFHDYMGNLKPLLFTFHCSKPNKASNTSIVTINISCECIAESLRINHNKHLPNSSQTTAKQLPYNNQTIMPNKQFSQSQAGQGVEPNFTTSKNKYELLNQGGATLRGQGNESTLYVSHRIMPPPKDKPVNEQSTEEWLADYDAAAEYRNRK